MNTSYNGEDEVTPLISRPGIPTAITDKREPYEKQLALYLILASILFERIAFYSLGDNLVSTLQSNKTVEWNSDHSATASFIFSGTRYISTLLFAAICDGKLGRTRTLIIGFAFYLIGYTLVTINANETASFCHFRNIKPHNATSIFNEPCAPWILSTLICTAIAAGTVQSNMTVFGAEQIRELKSISYYADKYMIAANIGDMLTLVAIPYIQRNGAGHYFIANLVAASMLLVAIVLFIIACRYCIHVKAYDTVITNCIPVVINAFQSWRKYKRDKYSMEEKTMHLSPTSCNSILYNFNEEESIRMNEQPSTFLDFAKAANDGKFPDRIVDDVNSLRRGIIAFSLLIPYWLIYIQIRSTFAQQAEKMKLPYESMPVLWMTLAEPVTIIVGIFTLNQFVYKHFAGWDKEKIIITKFVIGMCFGSLTMCAAGIVEIYRQKNCIGSKNSDLSIYFQIPQNVLMGISELFVIVASSEFAYFAAPRSAQSLFMSLRFSAAGIASLIGTVYSSVLLKPANEDPNSNCLGHKESWRPHAYFFILASVQLLSIFTFTVVHKKFRVFKLNPQQLRTNQFLQNSSMLLNNRQ